MGQNHSKVCRKSAPGMSSSQMFVIGNNGSHELGDIHCKGMVVPVLTKCPGKKISKAFSGYRYSIYADENYNNIYSAGSNAKGECCVGKKKLTLKQLNPITFFSKQ